MITREEAIEALLIISESGILAEDLEDKINSIVLCIEAELIGRHEWGVDDDKLAKLYTAVRSDLITDKDVDDYEIMHRKLTFIPSADERIIIESAICDKIENATGEEVSADDIKRWFERP